MKNQFLGLLVLLILWGLSGCERTPDPAATKVKKTTQRPVHAVETVVISRQAVRIGRTLTGTLEAPRSVRVRARQSGRILELPFHEGDQVEKGRLLVRLESALEQTNLAKAVASREQAEVTLQRLEKLVQKQLATEDALARANTEFKLAQALESQQRILLSHTAIQAPFAAVISQRLKEPGDIVSANEDILTLFDPDFMTVSVRLPEQLHSRVRVGHPVTLRIDSLGNQPHHAEILRVHPVVDARTHQGIVEIQLDPVPDGARPGQLSRIRLETAETLRHLIPLTALRFDHQGSFVYRLNAESRVLHVAVTTGLQVGDSIEVVDGIHDGDVVVVKGFAGLKPGKIVRRLQPSNEQAHLFQSE